MDHYRHELKYIISQAQIPLLRTRIEPFMSLDSHVGPRGSYIIRSVYFDDYYNTCYYENENGTDPREKFRIRIYNHSSDRIGLECKRKERGKTLKKSCLLTKLQTDKLINGGEVRIDNNQPPLLRKMLMLRQTRLLHPVTIVEYERIPYICRYGNVRVTFDMNMSSSGQFDCFFHDSISKRPIMLPGMQLLEVKFDEFLPDYIYSALNLSMLQQTSYSKYYLCRRYALKEGYKCQ